jgi:hypothetical protein
MSFIEDAFRPNDVNLGKFFEPQEGDSTFDTIDRLSGGGTAQGEALGIDTPLELIKNLSGASGAEAARTAAQLQEDFGREALTEQDIAQRRLEETLAPFVNFGSDLIPGFENLFQGNVPQSAAGSQNITDLTKFVDQMILDNPSMNPNAQSILNNAHLINAPAMLSRERSDLLSGIGLGQASAAQQAAGGLQTGAVRGDLLSQIGNVQAAGGIGAAQALGQGGENIVGLGTTLAQQFGRNR